MREFIILGIPDLIQKDKTRDFSDEQRIAIYYRDKGICQLCGKKCGIEEFHADYIIPFSQGGITKKSDG